MFLLTSVVLLSILLHVVHALPFEKRIVIDPTITSPSAGTVWTPGNTELVTWYVGFGDYLGVYGLANSNPQGSFACSAHRGLSRHDSPWPHDPRQY